MTKIEELTSILAKLSDEQVEALLDWARSMVEPTAYETASPEALASIARGLEQSERGETLTLEELDARLDKLAKSFGR